jgi:hypothetical protein
MRHDLISGVVNFYCDCSSYTGDNIYAVVGGIAIKAELVDDLVAEIQVLKDEVGMKSEFKWSEYRGGRKAETYRKLVDLFFTKIQENKINFHAMIADFQKFDHHKKGRGSPHLSVNKLYYQLMLHVVCRQYGQKHRIVMFPDRGPDSDSIIQFRDQLCEVSERKYSTIAGSLRAIQPLNSDLSLILQMNDVIIGAIAAHREQRKLNANKSELRDYVFTCSPVNSFAINTKRSEKNFTVWNFNNSN